MHELGFGTPHKGIGNCRYHAGLTRNARKSAMATQIEQEAQQLLGLSEWDPITDPFSALADLAGKVVKLQEIMHAKVEELTTLRQYGGEMGDRIDLVYEAWERALDRSLRTLQGMAKLDLEARIAQLQAAVDRETAAMVQRALAGALDTLDLTGEQRAQALAAFGHLLRVAQPAELTTA